MNNIYWTEMDAEVGLNHWVWPFQKINDERSPEELEQFELRMRRLGMSDTEIESRLSKMKYITEKAKPGNYQVIIEMDGETITKNLVMMKDFWHK